MSACRHPVVCVGARLVQLVVVLVLMSSAARGHDITTCVGVSSSGKQGNSDSQFPALSQDGRYVAFDSLASNLVPGDTNGAQDVFVHDRLSGETTRVSMCFIPGVQANGNSMVPSITPDGRYVAFHSDATNLVPGDHNFQPDVFVHDRSTGLTGRVSLDSAGNPAIGASYLASISADGRYVAFTSSAINLVPCDTNNREDIFVHDRVLARTTRVSVDSSQEQANHKSGDGTISADGRYVAFDSWASNLVPGDTNGAQDIFVHDRETGTTTRVSVDDTGAQVEGGSLRPSLSADGRYVAFDGWSLIPNDPSFAIDVYVHDRQTGKNTRVSVNDNGVKGNAMSYLAKISSSGDRVAFQSHASNLVPDVDPYSFQQVYLRDLSKGRTWRVSVTTSGDAGNDNGYLASISGDGRYVGFFSAGSNFFSHDQNWGNDAFVHGPEFTLEAAPASVGVGELLTLTTYRGTPGAGASLWAVNAGGTPVLVMIAHGSFLSDETFAIAGPVPPGIPSIDIAFRAYAIGKSGFVEASNDATVHFR